VPGAATELAVGRRPQSDVLLHADDVEDRLVFDRAQLGVVDAPLGMVGARAQEPLWAQQATDVVGAKRGLGTVSGNALRLPDPRSGEPLPE
jgi:hypothetical protein